MERMFTILWQNNSEPGKGLTLLILFLAVVAAFHAAKHTRRYRKHETQALEKVRLRLRLETEAHPQQLVSLESLSEAVKSRRSLIADRLAAVAKMRQAHVKVNVNFLQEMSVLQESANRSLAFPGYVVSLAMMLGLLGTFIGLAWMAQNIQISLPPTLDSGSPSPKMSDLNKSFRSLADIVTGLKTAFSTTLVGLFCSISVSGLNFRLARAQAGFYNLLERFTSEELLPKTVPAVEDANLLEKVSLQLEQSFERIEAITKDHTQNIDRMEAMTKAFGQIIEHLKDITHREATADGSDFVGSVTGLVREMAKVNTTIAPLTQAIPRLSNDFTKTQQQTLQELSTLLTTQQDRMEKIFSVQMKQERYLPLWIRLQLFFTRMFEILKDKRQR